MRRWFEDAIFYHIFPLGLLGALKGGQTPQKERPRGIGELVSWFPHIKDIGCNALLLGPVFESANHGYETSDYGKIDRRLGGDEEFSRFADTCHREGLRLVLDGVFNHTGREFFAFKDLRERGQSSSFARWYRGVDFAKNSPFNDGFSYEGWAGFLDLPRLDTDHPEVCAYLIDAAIGWIRKYDIDGIRLDAADQVSLGFQKRLAEACKREKPDFWLMGEIIHGDYRTWANPAALDSTTNYECFKGLWSSLNDANYFEIAYALERQFGEKGMYRGLPLYNFVDNHDVTRVASQLKDEALLYPLYCMLFAMPGVPSIYYGSEWGLMGIKVKESDRPLRPAIDAPLKREEAGQPDLAEIIARLARIRRGSEAIKYGSYRQLAVLSEQMAFERAIPGGDGAEGERIIAAFNSSKKEAQLSLQVGRDASYRDLLNPGKSFRSHGGRLALPIDPSWARILREEGIVS